MSEAPDEVWESDDCVRRTLVLPTRLAERLAARAEQWLGGQEWELVRCERLLVSPED